MEISWLEQFIADVPLDDEWLSVGEQLVLAGMKILKRRADWRLGRWAAKRAITAYLELPSDPRQLAAIEIRPAATGAPEVFFDNQPAGISISLSHRNGTGTCAVVSPGGVVGCDLELVEPRSDAFVGDYFTAEERGTIGCSSPEQRDCVVTVLWSAKESALKALRTGLRVDTRCVSACIHDGPRHAVALGDNSGMRIALASREWLPLSVCYEEDQVLAGWWQCIDKLVRTVVSIPAAGPPIALSMSGRVRPAL